MKTAISLWVTLLFGLLSALTLGFERLDACLVRAREPCGFNRGQRSTARQFVLDARRLCRVGGFTPTGGRTRLVAALQALCTCGGYDLANAVLSPPAAHPGLTGPELAYLAPRCLPVRSATGICRTQALPRDRGQILNRTPRQTTGVVRTLARTPHARRRA